MNDTRPTKKDTNLHHGLIEGETLAAALIRVRLASDIASAGAEDVQLLAHILMEHYDITPKEGTDG